MTTFYISGPMRGKPDYNRDLFDEVEHALINEIKYAGYPEGSEVINPCRNFGGDQTLEPNVYMNLDLKQVLKADVIVLIPGWRESPGACKEAQLAIWAGKTFWEAEFNVYGSDDEGEWSFTEADISAPGENPSPRADLLDEARALITGDRNNAYGPPTQDFIRSADAMNAYGYRGPDGRPLLSHDIAVLVICIKLSRLMWTPKLRDNWADLAGYAGCGFECSQAEE